MLLFAWAFSRRQERRQAQWSTSAPNTGLHRPAEAAEDIRRIKSQDGPDLILSGSSTLTSRRMRHIVSRPARLRARRDVRIRPGMLKYRPDERGDGFV